MLDLPLYKGSANLRGYRVRIWHLEGKKRFWLADSNDHNFLSFWSRTKFLVSRIISCSRSLHFCEKFSNFGNLRVPYHASEEPNVDVIQPKGRFVLEYEPTFGLDYIDVGFFRGMVWYPQVPEIRKLFAKMKRSRAGDNPRYQKLCSTPKTKKVMIV